MGLRQELKDLRDLGTAELQAKVPALKEELMKLRFRKAAGQLQHSAEIGKVRKQLARVETVLREAEHS